MRSRLFCLLLLFAIFAPKAICQDSSQADLIKHVYDANYPWEHPFKYGDLFKPKYSTSIAPLTPLQTPPVIENLPDARIGGETPPYCDEASKALNKSFIRFASKEVLQQADAAFGVIDIECGVPKKVQIQKLCSNDNVSSILKLAFRSLRLNPNFTSNLSWTFKLENKQPVFIFRACSKDEFQFERRKTDAQQEDSFKPDLVPVRVRDSHIRF